MSGFGEFLLEGGLIDEEQYRRAIRTQLEMLKPLGRLAVEEGCLSEDQVRELRVEQQRRDRPLGDLALDRTWISHDDLKRLVSLQQDRRKRLGEILVAAGALSEMEMLRALDEFDAVSSIRRKMMERVLKDVPFGRFLRELVGFTGKHLERATGENFSLSVIDYEPRCLTLGGMKDKMAVCQEINRDFLYALVLDQPWMEFISSKMYEFDTPPEGEMISDAIKELVNLIVGNSLAALGPDGEGFQPHPPGILRPGQLLTRGKGCLFLEFYGPRGVINACIFSSRSGRLRESDE